MAGEEFFICQKEAIKTWHVTRVGNGVKDRAVVTTTRFESFSFCPLEFPFNSRHRHHKDQEIRGRKIKRVQACENVQTVNYSLC